MNCRNRRTQTNFQWPYTVISHSNHFWTTCHRRKTITSSVNINLLNSQSYLLSAHGRRHVCQRKPLPARQIKCTTSASVTPAWAHTNTRAANAPHSTYTGQSRHKQERHKENNYTQITQIRNKIKNTLTNNLGSGILSKAGIKQRKEEITYTNTS